MDGDQEIVLLDPNTGEATPLTDNRSEDFGPRWSPDGKLLAYISDQAGNLDIHLADQREETVIRLTHSDEDDTAPRWSPDGLRLAFISDRDGNSEVYLMETDGSSQTRITSNTTGEEMGDWSPDNVWLAFSRNEDDSDDSGGDSKEGLWLRNPDGVNLVHLTKGQDSAPVWSPNGRDIAFVRTDGQNSDIYIVSKLKDGTWQESTELTRLTQHESNDLAPAWSPDSKTLAFVSFRDDNAEIYTMGSDGSKQRRLTNNGADDLAPGVVPQRQTNGICLLPVRRRRNLCHGLRRGQAAALDQQRRQRPFSGLVASGLLPDFDPSDLMSQIAS